MRIYVLVIHKIEHKLLKRKFHNKNFLVLNKKSVKILHSIDIEKI